MILLAALQVHPMENSKLTMERITMRRQACLLAALIWLLGVLTAGAQQGQGDLCAGVDVQEVCGA